MTDTPSGQDSSAETDDQELEEFRKGVLKFGDQTTVGDLQFLVRTWSAWLVAPKGKRVAPILRLYIGDMSGNLIFERTMVLTGLIDLLQEFADAVSSELSRLNDLAYTIVIPAPQAEIQKLLESARDSIDKSIEAMGKLTFSPGGMPEDIAKQEDAEAAEHAGGTAMSGDAPPKSR